MKVIGNRSECKTGFFRQSRVVRQLLRFEFFCGEGVPNVNHVSVLSWRTDEMCRD
jgi:hypothetical protein